MFSVLVSTSKWYGMGQGRGGTPAHVAVWLRAGKGGQCVAHSTGAGPSLCWCKESQGGQYFEHMQLPPDLPIHQLSRQLQQSVLAPGRIRVQPPCRGQSMKGGQAAVKTERLRIGTSMYADKLLWRELGLSLPAGQGS